MKKGCFLFLAGLFSAYSIQAQVNSRFDLLVQEYEKDSTTVFEEESLAFLNNSELKILLNYPFAKRRLIFTDSFLFNYFSGFSWYRPVFIKETDSLFTESDRLNMEKITAFIYATPIPISDAAKFANALNGCWQTCVTTVDTGNRERYSFSIKNKHIKYFANREPKKPGLQFASGRFQLIHPNILKIEILQKITNQVQIKKNYTDKSSGKIYPVKEPVRVTKDVTRVPETDLFITGPIRQAFINGTLKTYIKLGSDMYNLISKDPDSCTN